MLHLKLAKKEDVLALVPLFYEFYKFSKYVFSFDAPTVIKLAEDIVENPNAVIIMLMNDDKPVGVLAGMSSYHMFAPYKVATELVWYVQPEHRGKESLQMLKAFEYWAKEKMNCAAVTMASLSTNTQVNKLYQRLGYKEVEQTFMKELT